MKKSGLIVLGLICILSAAPAGVMAAISANGCCGAPSRGLEWVGPVVGGALLIFGLILFIKGLILGSINIRRSLNRIILAFWISLV